jgi:glycosyltransferase involved in cell wall biosynthesis
MPPANLSSESADERAMRPWRVLHTCERTSTVVALAEAEIIVGMTPQVLSREFWKTESHNVSLLTTWDDVRDWRRALNEAEAVNSFHLVHAHSFAAAMAGVRGSLPLVYDFACTLDELTSDESHPGAWLLRSFRVAEQFALSRASAVVTHSRMMAKIAHDRGAAKASVFRIPPPFVPEKLTIDQPWAHAQDIEPARDFVVLALANNKGVEFSLSAFASLARELPNAVLLLECEERDRVAIMRLAQELKVVDSLRCISSQERGSALPCANLVLALPTGNPGARSNQGMLAAMGDAKPVVAADVFENRECSEDGAGCLWFHENDIEDLSKRILHLSNKEEFRRELGESGRQYLLSTRAPEVIGRAYDEVYRHAQSRRTDSIPLLPAPKIYALGPV